MLKIRLFVPFFLVVFFFHGCAYLQGPEPQDNVNHPSTPGVLQVSKSSLSIVESVSDILSFSYSAAPDATKNLTFTVVDTGLVTLSPSSMVFTPTAFSAQTLTIQTLDNSDFSDYSTQLEIYENGSLVKTINLAITNNDKYVFNMLPPSQGNLGGISGADAICQGSPSATALGTVLALVADGANRSASPRNNWVIKPYHTYYRKSDNGVVFTADGNGLYDFVAKNLDGGFFITPAGSTYFTGLNSDWTTQSNTCGGWTLKTGQTQTGMGDAVDSTSIFSSFLQNCSVGAQLVCVQQ